MIEPKIPNTSVDHSIGRGGHDGPDDGAGEAVVPVVEFVDGEGAGDEGGAEEGRVQGEELPHGRVVVGEDFELGVEVVVEVEEAWRGAERRVGG